jgi:hypothetical protein
MSEGKVFRVDVIMIILLMGVVLAGFWMTGTAMDAQMGVLEQKIEVVQTQTKGNMQTLSEIREAIRQLKASTAAAAMPPAAAPAPAPAKK